MSARSPLRTTGGLERELEVLILSSQIVFWGPTLQQFEQVDFAKSDRRRGTVLEDGFADGEPLRLPRPAARQYWPERKRVDTKGARLSAFRRPGEGPVTVVEPE